MIVVEIMVGQNWLQGFQSQSSSVYLEKNK